MEPITDAERRATFDYYLRRAIFFGERHEVSCVGITGQTWNAIAVVAGEFPNVTYESVVSARDELERQLDGRQSDGAMRNGRKKKYDPEVLRHYGADAIRTHESRSCDGHVPPG